MESKKLVTGDYIDTDTGLRFVEDIRGNLHCCSMFDMSNTSPTPTPPISIPPIDVSIPPIEIPPVEVTIPPITIENPYKNAVPIILQSTITGTTWATTTAWNRINNSYGSGYVAFTTPFDKELHITNLVVNQTMHGSQLSKHSVIGLFKAGNLIMSFPVIQELNFTFFQPYIVEHSTFVEFKYKPFDASLWLSILAIGYLI